METKTFIEGPKELVLNYIYPINVKEIVNRAREYGSVCFLCIFGSSLDSPKYYPTNHSFLWFHWVTKKRIYAKDVDILVVLNDSNATSIESYQSLPVRYMNGNGYDFWWEDREDRDKLHFVIASICNVEKALKKKDVDIITILRNSKFLSGFIDVYDKLKQKALVA